ncbi:hypothetical protein GIB67_029434 [Kingdonia uniflora]|uniref:Retrotransposon gag domain-containing protein n=1 Tax=Kingdonia uniflora TaxID=39325 RepID=A0A7J7NXT7_9MAGN|nr:hypothetical protein GIB67_029434 [Kingdonia uniflora]
MLTYLSTSCVMYMDMKPAEEFHTGVGFQPKPISVEKQVSMENHMANPDNFEFLVTEATMMVMPRNLGTFGGNERSIPSSGFGNGFLPVELKVQRASGRIVLQNQITPVTTEIHQEVDGGLTGIRQTENPPRRVQVLIKGRLSEGSGNFNLGEGYVTCPATTARHYVTREYVEKQIKELLKAQTKTTKGIYDRLQRSPIRKELLDGEVLARFHTQKIQKYKGTNPMVYVQEFQDTLGLNLTSNHILCRLFPTSLSGKPLRCFHMLPEGSITTFKKLRKLFDENYLYNRDKEENLYSLFSLMHIQRGKLDTFTKKFMELTRKVDKLDQKITILAINNALHIDGRAKEYHVLIKPTIWRT